jgi:hypothetical protein
VSDFAGAVIENDALTLEQEIIETLQAQFEGWEPAEGNLETWLIKAIARITSTTREQAARISKEAFKRFGESIVNVPPIQAAAATAASTWMMVDDTGYTIPAGTLVSIAAAGDEVFGFRTVADVTVAPGDEATEIGSVILRAVEIGEVANGLTEDPALSDSLAFVTEIELDGVSANGVDAEDEDAYLTRLAETLQLLSLSLIVPPDFEIDARAVAGVARAVCIPGYDADAELEDQPLCVTVVAIDQDGATIGALQREELQQRQAAKVPSGVENFVGVATYTGIDLEVEIAVLPGFDPAATVEAVSARLGAYLHPSNCGIPTGFGDTGNSAGWVKVDAVYRNDLIAEADRIQGCDRVVTLKLAKAGDELKVQESVVLDGIAPLTEAGDIEVSAV